MEKSTRRQRISKLIISGYSFAVMMPPSALARLSESSRLRPKKIEPVTHERCPTAQMEIESPWLFELSNTGVNLADHKVTHAGVLEFIADEGHVHLPAWVSGSRRRVANPHRT